jgi:peptide/nickel transport system substrate-binding protein
MNRAQVRWHFRVHSDEDSKSLVTRALRHSRRRSRWARVLCLGLVLTLGATMLWALGGRADASSPTRGGSLTVLENSIGEWPVGLDPATNTSDLADAPYMNSIFGTLFDVGPNGKLVGNLATGYKFINGGKGFEISLRHGVTFTDGTPLDAQVVKWNITRDLLPANGCICDSNFPVASVSTPNRYTVVLNLTQVFAQIGYAFMGAAPNWIASETAEQKMGEKAFELKPVGAGPFEVMSNSPNTKLVLKRNPSYWEKGHPELDSLTFQIVGSDASAYDAVLSGQAQVYQNYTTYTNLKSLSHNVKVGETGSPGPYDIQFNTTMPPFNNILAREAIYYATNAAPISKSLAAGNGTVVENMTVPGGLFYEKTVPGYRSYDLAKAKALVKQLGGLSFTLTNAISPASNNIVAALASEWAKAGIAARLNDVTLTQIIQIFFANNRKGSWQAIQQNAGGLDPVIPDGLDFRFLSTSPFTGIHDPKLDALAARAEATLDPEKQKQIYDQIWKYMNDKAYGPFLFNVPTMNLYTPSVSGITGNLYGIRWQNVTVH